MIEMFTMENFKLEKGSPFPDYDDNLFFVMRDYYDFPETIIQRVNRIIDLAVKKYEREHQQHIELSKCQLSVWLEIDRHTKVMCLNILILDDKREIEIEGKEQIKPSDNLYFECQGIFMYRLEEFLFIT